MDKNEAIAISRKYISVVKSAGFQVVAAYLFGSAAKGNSHPDSDLDVAIILENLSNSFDAQVELMKLRRSIDLRIEPHPFPRTEEQDASALFQEVLRTGIKVA